MSAIIRAYQGMSPRIATTAFVADGAVLVGDVELGDEASVWYGAVLRGDVGSIRIGARTNIQDVTCIHMTGGLSHTLIGSDVTVGHGVIIHGAIIHDGALVGMGSVVLDNAEIGAEALVAAGTIVPPRMHVPPRSLVRGQPGKIVRELTDEERRQGRHGAGIYLELARAHRAG